MEGDFSSMTTRMRLWCNERKMSGEPLIHHVNITHSHFAIGLTSHSQSSQQDNAIQRVEVIRNKHADHTIRFFLWKTTIDMMEIDFSDSQKYFYNTIPYSRLSAEVNSSVVVGPRTSLSNGHVSNFFNSVQLWSSSLVTRRHKGRKGRQTMATSA